MRIAIFCDSYYPQINGVATSVQNFAEELGRKGHQVLVFTPRSGKGPEPEPVENVKIIYSRSVPALIYPEYRVGVLSRGKNLQILREFDPDILHFHTIVSMGMDALVAAKALRKPLVGTNHVYITKGNAQAICVLPGMKLVEKHLASASLAYMRIFYDPCDLCLAPSRRLIEGLRQSGYDKPFEYLPNGVPLTDAKPLTQGQRSAFRQKYGLRGKVILHFGRLSKEKDIHELIRAFAIVNSQEPETSLLLIGDGPARKSLESLSAELGVADRVVFAGAIDHAELLQSGIIAIGDVFATASKMENHPMVVLEAMTHGLPIVGMAAAGMADVVDGNGFLAEPGDVDGMAKHILSVVRDPNLAASMDARSRALAEEFSIGNVTDRLLELYQGVLQKDLVKA